MPIIDYDFFIRPTLVVAKELLGQRLVCILDGQRLSGLIVETEAYIGLTDSACHAHKGRTARTELMFGSPARTYIYLIYGMHYMLNITTEPLEFPAAVLIRALQPTEGLEVMKSRRRLDKGLPYNLTNGPGKLSQALGIDKNINDWDVTSGQKLWLEKDESIPKKDIAVGSRIGIGYAREKDINAPWRFWVRGNRFVSR